MGALLSVTGLTVGYGGQPIVRGVDLAVGAGRIVGLIGANGAGKTTTIDAVTGFAPHGGSVQLDGRELGGLRPHQRARAGVARTWQGIELFDDLDVRRNCEVAARPAGWRGLVSDLAHRPVGAEAARRVDEALDAVGLLSDAARRPNELSHGHQKLLGVARALAGAPRVLLLDEPAAGLDPAESDELGATLRSVVERSGIGVLLVDHDTRLVFDVCDEVAVLDAGALVATGTPAEVRADPKVIEAYLGTVS